MKKSMKKAMLVLGIVVMAIFVQSCEPKNGLEQKFVVSGIVTDVATGNPIEHCMVYLTHQTPSNHIRSRANEPVATILPTDQERCLTDSSGRFEFANLYAGTYYIKAEAQGYVSLDLIEITLSEESKEVNLQLERNPEDSKFSNPLINLAELGENLSGKSLTEIDNLLLDKGWAKFYEDHNTIGTDVFGSCYYSIGIQLDSTCFGEELTNKILLQEDNACILMVDYFNENGQMSVELAASYILPDDPKTDYKTLSENLYRYCSTNYSFKASTEITEELARGYMWYGDIDIDSTYLYYCNDDELYNFALQAGWMTKAEYDEEMADYEDDFRIDFVERINHSYLAVYEEIEAVDFTQDKYMYTALLMSDEYDTFFEANGTMIAECYWVDHWPELPMPIKIQKQFPSKGRKAYHKFHWRYGEGGSSNM